MQKQHLLQLQNISVQYSGVKALDGVSITLDGGEIVALMGPNGAGKSTILKAIFGLVPIVSGEVLWRGSHLIPLPHQIAKLGIAFVPQGRRVFKHLTVEENLEIGGFMIQDKSILQRRIKEVMGVFPVLGKKRKAKSVILSGGEQQMLSIARGLVVHPEVLLLDEPSLGLAPKIVKEVFEKIKEIKAKYETTIMVVEHNIRSILNIADRAYVLDKGKIAAEGVSQIFQESDILEKVFLGEFRAEEVEEIH